MQKRKQPTKKPPQPIQKQSRRRKSSQQRVRVYKKETMYSVMMRGFFKGIKLAFFNIIPRDGYKGIHCFDYRD